MHASSAWGEMHKSYQWLVVGLIAVNGCKCGEVTPEDGGTFLDASVPRV